MSSSLDISPIRRLRSPCCRLLRHISFHSGTPSPQRRSCSLRRLVPCCKASGAGFRTRRTRLCISRGGGTTHGRRRLGAAMRTCCWRYGRDGLDLLVRGLTIASVSLGCRWPNLILMGVQNAQVLNLSIGYHSYCGRCHHPRCCNGTFRPSQRGRRPCRRGHRPTTNDDFRRRWRWGSGWQRRDFV